MKHLLISACLVLCSAANAQAIPWISVDIKNAPLGSGVPAKRVTIGEDTAFILNDGYYHIPQYMSYYPTASVIWPRVIEVQCDVVVNNIKCDGYNWSPSMGRGEYLMFAPKMREKPPAPATPACCTADPKTVIILKEVPVKAKGG